MSRGLGLIFLQSSGTSKHQAGVGLQRMMEEPSSPDSVTATGPGPPLNRPDVPQSLSWERICQLLPFTLQTVMFQTQSQELWAYSSAAELLDVLYGPLCTPTMFLPCLCILYPTMKTCYLLPLSSSSFACACLSHPFLSFQEFKDIAFFPWQVSFCLQHCSELHGWFPSMDSSCSSGRSSNVMGNWPKAIQSMLLWWVLWPILSNVMWDIFARSCWERSSLVFRENDGELFLS